MTAVAADKREEALKVAGELLNLLDLPATLDAKDAVDGGLSLAVMLEKDFPPAPPQRRSPFNDALQLLVNKLVNRPGSERRYIALGIGAHPPPRGSKPVPAPAQPAPAPVASPAPPAQAPRRAAPAAPPPRMVEDEGAIEVSEDPQLAAAVRKLAEQSARLGRFYAVAAMGSEDRARAVKACGGVAGVKVRAEGEGRNRRLVFAPDKPVPMPRRALPADDDEELE